MCKYRFIALYDWMKFNFSIKRTNCKCFLLSTQTKYTIQKCTPPAVNAKMIGYDRRDSGGLYFLFSDGPSGKPVAEPTTSSKHEGQEVILTCNNPNDDGNPNCNIYTWNKLEGNQDTIPKTKTLEFIMDEYLAGNYTCTCANIYGISAVSNVAEVIYLAGLATPAIPTTRTRNRT